VIFKPALAVPAGSQEPGRTDHGRFLILGSSRIAGGHRIALDGQPILTPPMPTSFLPRRRRLRACRMWFGQHHRMFVWPPPMRRAAGTGILGKACASRRVQGGEYKRLEQGPWQKEGPGSRRFYNPINRPRWQTRRSRRSVKFRQPPNDWAVTAASSPDRVDSAGQSRRSPSNVSGRPSSLPRPKGEINPHRQREFSSSSSLFPAPALG